MSRVTRHLVVYVTAQIVTSAFLRPPAVKYLSRLFSWQQLKAIILFPERNIANGLHDRFDSLQAPLLVKTLYRFLVKNKVILLYHRKS